MNRYPMIVMVFDLLVLSTLAGCAAFRRSPARGSVETYTGPDGKTIYFPKQGPTNVYLEARIRDAPIILNENGCIGVENGSGNLMLILWHSDFTLRVAGDQVEVLNSEDQVVARVGEKVTMGGGEVPLTVIPGLPLKDCPTEKYWQLGDIQPLP